MNSPTLNDEPKAPVERPTDWERLKVELNNLTVMYAPGSITLAQAEEAMLRYITYLQDVGPDE